MKKKLLWYSDTPTAITGFGKVAKYILNALVETNEYEITVVGINQKDWYDQTEYPYKIRTASAGGRVYGEDVFVQELFSTKWDVVVFFNDLFLASLIQEAIQEAKKIQKFKYVIYTPVDAERLDASVFEPLKDADVPVLYNEFSRELVEEKVPELKGRIRVINHGTDIESFKPIQADERDKFRKQVFGIDNSTFLIVSINRNQWRKDYGKTLQAYKKFHDLVPNSLLYIHAKVKDMGGNLMGQALACGLTPDDIRFTSKDFDTFTGVKEELLGYIYNAGDLFVTSTKGEGWGLTVTEAMACRTPVLVPRNTSLIEIVGKKEERGTFIECGTNENEWRFDYGFSDVLRPEVNIPDFVKKLLWVRNNRKEVERRANKAFDWVTKITWQAVCEQWKKAIGDELE